MSEHSARRRRISTAVSRKLGYYVYLYVNPLDDEVFYVGKGQGSRALAHLNASRKWPISKTIRKIRAAGKEPVIELLAHRLTPDAAHKIEAAAIDLLRLGNLDNAVRGHGAKYGRMQVEQAVAHYTKKQVNIKEPAILIRISRLYRYDMNPVELYDTTRGAWRVGPRCEKAELALAVFQGICREVYRVRQWFKSGATFNSRHNGRGSKLPGRREFVGIVAEDKLRKRYVDRYVGHYLAEGGRNPIAYVNM
ncbi:MAG TPA: hypothetical protein PK280_08325 [Planctomycetota bacterium]|nr:hypothetical protein [Planctomycetota bacterium]